MTAVALVSVEVLGVSRLSPTVLRGDRAPYRIPARNIVLSATHTHCAPVTLNHFLIRGNRSMKAYLDKLAAGITHSVVRAYEARRRPDSDRSRAGRGHRG